MGSWVEAPGGPAHLLQGLAGLWAAWDLFLPNLQAPFPAPSLPRWFPSLSVDMGISSCSGMVPKTHS